MNERGLYLVDDNDGLKKILSKLNVDTNCWVLKVATVATAAETKKKKKLQKLSKDPLKHQISSKQRGCEIYTSC